MPADTDSRHGLFRLSDRAASERIVNFLWKRDNPLAAECMTEYLLRPKEEGETSRTANAALLYLEQRMRKEHRSVDQSQGLINAVIGTYHAALKHADSLADWVPGAEEELHPTVGLTQEAIADGIDSVRAKLYVQLARLSHEQKGPIELRKGQQRESLDEAALYHMALKLDPKNVGAHFDLGRAAAEQGDYQEAETHLSAAAAERPDDKVLLTELGLIRSRLARQANH